MEESAISVQPCARFRHRWQNRALAGRRSQRLTHQPAMPRVAQVFVLAIGFISGCAGCRDDSNPTTVSREGRPEDQLEVVITQPEADAEVPIGEPIPCVVEVTNITGGGAPETVALSIERNGAIHNSTLPQLVEGEYPHGGPYRFEGSLTIRDSAREGTYLLRAKTVSTWYEEPTTEEGERQLKVLRFESEGVEITAKRKRD